MKKELAICLAAAAAAGIVGSSMIFTDREIRRADAAVATETPAEIKVVIDDEEYRAENRQWQGIPGVEVTGEGRIWACYLTGGPKEPDGANYVAYGFSDDGGETWYDSYFIADLPGDDLRAYDPNLWLDPFGRLWCTWCQARGSYSDLRTWAVILDDPDAPAEELAAQIEAASPRFLADGVKLNKPIVLANGEWMFFTAATTPTAITVWASKDNGATWQARSSVSGNGLSVTEPMAVETEQGIVLYTRIEGKQGGGIGMAVSTDNGYTWSDYRSELEAPLRGPSSRFAVTKLRSGNLLLVNNASETSRTALTAYLSTDGGSTWSSSIVLDERSEVSYPDVTQDDDGYIYVVYDKGRYAEKEIRITKFTEEDIVRGAFLSEGSRVRIAVSVLGEDKDIRSVKTEFVKTVTAKMGTPVSEIRATLPREIVVADEDGNEYTLIGMWSAASYDAETPGTYVLMFNATESLLRYGLFDAHNYLTVAVTLEDDGNEALMYGLIGGGAGVLAVAAAVTAAVAVKKKKRKNIPGIGENKGEKL